MHVQHSVLSLLLLVESAAVSNRRGVPDDSANTITYDTVHLIAHASKHIKQCVDLNELEGQLSNREHATVTWSSAAMCGDPAGTAQAQCVRSIRLFVLHQLSIMALDLAKTRFCCVAMDELARELDRLLHVPTLSRVHVAAGRAARAARSVANAATAATAIAADAPARQHLRLAVALHAKALSLAQAMARIPGDTFQTFLLEIEMDGRWSDALGAAVTAAESLGAACSGREHDACSDPLLCRAPPGVISERLLDNATIAALQSEYERNGGWVLIRNFLNRSFAERLRAQLSEMPPDAWHQSSWIVKSGGFNPMQLRPNDRPLNIPNDREHKSELAQAKQSAVRGHARNDFAYCFLRTKTAGAAADTATAGCPFTPPRFRASAGHLCNVESALLSAHVRGVLRRITRIPVAAIFQDVFASQYRPGDFLGSHADKYVAPAIAARNSYLRVSRIPHSTTTNR